MSDTRHILEDEALDFVLTERRTADRHEESDDLVATIRGDLEQVSLPDIFQTLTMSAMRGTLRISQGWDPTYVHFADGQVRVLAPEELSARRLGNRLVTSGLLDAKQVRTAFVRARKESAPLGEILEATGKIEKVQYDAIRLALEEDFLLELFTLRAGAFAFFKESYPIPGLEERFAQCMPFETDQVLLEIARRADEWVQILETLGDLDELFVRSGTNYPESDDLRGDLYQQIDGKRTLRDIGGGMLDALFDVAKAAQWLVLNDCIELAPAAHLLKLARETIDDQKLRRSLFYLKLIVENRRTRPDQLEEVASLFVQAGDPRAAADVMLRIVQRTPDPERKHELLLQARALDGLNLAILEELVGMLRETAIAGEPQFDKALEDLCVLFVDADRHEEALALCEELEIAHPADIGLASRKARILHALGRRDDGVAHLERLKDVYREQRNPEALTKVLEQILRIDPRHQRARVELRALQESKGVRRLKRFAAVLIVALIGRVGWGFWAEWRDGEVARQDLARATELLDSGRTAEASKLAADISAREIDDESVARAVAIIGAAKRQLEESETKKKQALVALVQRRIDAAIAELDAGRWVKALASYSAIAKEFHKNADAKKRILQSVRARLQSLQDELKRELASFQSEEPTMKVTTESSQDRQRLHARMQEWFAPATIEAARALATAHASKSLDSPQELTQDMATLLGRYVEIGSAHRTRVTALGQEIDKDSRTAALNDAFVEARKCEEAYDFKRAAKLYAELSESYEGAEETAKIFRAKRDLYREIHARLGKLRVATRGGDHKSARESLAQLREEWPSIPFEKLVALPLRIDSSPRGARVYDGKKEIGKTPVLVEYAPGKTLDLRLELDGFFPVRAPENSEEAGSYETVFELKPTAKAALEGSTTRKGVLVAGRYIASDRKATLMAVDPADGRQIWKRVIREDSGDLGAMLALVNRVVLASPSGVVRAISPIDGSEVWRRDLGTRITTPAAEISGEIVVLDRSGKAHILDASTGEVAETLDLGEAVSYPPIRVGEDRFAVLDTSAVLHVYDKKGQRVWQEAIAGAGWVPPVRFASSILVVGGKRLESRRIEDGGLEWSTSLEGTPRLEIAIDQNDESIALVVGNRKLVRLDAKGKIRATRNLLARPSAAPLLLGSSALVPLEKGGTVVHEMRDLSLVSLLSTATTTEIPPLLLGKRSVLISANSGELEFFDPSMLAHR